VRSRGSLGKAVFVVQELSMIEIRTLDVGGCALGNSPDVGGERFGIAPLETFIALPQSFRDGAGHRFAGGLGNRLGETVGFRILDVEAHGASSLLYQSSTLPL
jgi:hypothetical protein